MTEEESDQPGKQGNKVESNNCMKKRNASQDIAGRVNKMQETEEFVIKRSEKIC